MAVVSENYIDYVVAGECDGSVKAYQAHRDTLWGAIEGNTWTVVYKVISNVRGPTVVDISGSTVASVVINVRKGEFTEKAAIGFGRECLVGTVFCKRSSQQWHFYYAFMLGSLSFLPMMSGRVFLPLRIDIFCVERMRRNSAAGTIAVRPCVTRTTAIS